MNKLCMQHNNNKYEEKQNFRQLTIIFMPIWESMVSYVFPIYLCNNALHLYIKYVPGSTGPITGFIPQ